MVHPNEQRHPTQKGSADGVIFFGEIDEAQVQGGVLLQRQFLQSWYYEHHVNRRALGFESTLLFLRQNVLALALETQATCDYFEEYLACVSHERNATIVATLTSIFLLAKHLCRCIFPLLRHATSCTAPMISRNLSVRFSFAGQTLQELGREIIGPYRLSVRHRPDRVFNFIPRRGIVRWSALEPLLKLVHNARIKGRRLDVKQFVKPPHPMLADEGIIPQHSTFLVPNGLRVERSLPLHIHPL